MCCIKLGDAHSKLFKPSKGVRQGCVLSPILFNIFLSDLPQVLEDCGCNLELGKQELSCLLWADDILIFSNSAVGLQIKLDRLASFCALNKLIVNTDQGKTESMIFNKTGRLIRHQFTYSGENISQSRDYKYLGFLVTPSGEIRSGLEDLRVRAFKALFKIKRTLGVFFHKNIKNTIQLYNSMVKPILHYLSDFWGCLKMPRNNPIEKLHNQFCRMLLGVQKQTHVQGCLLELGVNSHYASG